MALITGTIDGLTLVSSNGLNKTYELSCSFAAHTGGVDTATILAPAAAINTHARNGKTAACVVGVVPMRGNPGYDTAGVAVYAGTIALAGAGAITDLTFDLTNSAQVSQTCTASTGVKILVTVLES